MILRKERMKNLYLLNYRKLRKAKETLKATQNTIEAVNKEKKAVEDGSSVWKAFGNSAM